MKVTLVLQQCFASKSVCLRFVGRQAVSGLVPLPLMLTHFYLGGGV